MSSEQLCDHTLNGESTELEYSNAKVCMRCQLRTPMPKKPGLIERLLCKLFPYTDILRDDTNDIYLRRFFIYPRDKDFGKNKGKGRIYLHKFYRGDEDAHLHDHPWPFSSLILTKGYWEETTDEETPTRGSQMHCWTLGADNEHRQQAWYPRFSLLKRPAKWKHRVVLDDETPVWTIVKTGVKERSWGFWIMDKMCPWRDYKDGVCWCEPNDVLIKGDS